MLSPGRGGIAISPVPSVAAHGQKWEETVSQVPAGKAVELPNCKGNLDFLLRWWARMYEVQTSEGMAT